MSTNDLVATFLIIFGLIGNIYALRRIRANREAQR
jgi:hypothetical protein